MGAAGPRSGMPPRELGWHWGAFLAVLLLVQVPRLSGATRGYLDFDHAYYPAAVTIRHDPSHLYDGATYDAATGRLHLTAPAYFVNLPIVAWLFVPLTWLPPPQAGGAWLLLNIAVAVACLARLQRRIGPASPTTRWLLTLAFVTSGPLMNALNLGQTTPLILLLLLLAEDRLRRSDEVGTGVLLGLVGLIKIPPLLLLGYFAFRRRWHLVGSAAAVLLAATLLSLCVYGWTLHATYVDVAIRAHLGTALAAHNCQSIDALLARLTTAASVASWQPVVLAPAVRIVKWLVVATLGFVCVRRLTARAAVGYPRMLSELGMIMCVALVVTPVYWVHYGAWLLPVAAAVAGVAYAGNAVRGVVPILVAAVLLINFPVPPPAIIARFGDSVWFRVAISHQLFGTLVLCGLCAWSAAHAAVHVTQGSPP